MHTGVLQMLWRQDRSLGWPPRTYHYVLALESFLLSGVAPSKYWSKLVHLLTDCSCLKDGIYTMYSISLSLKKLLAVLNMSSRLWLMGRLSMKLIEFCSSGLCVVSGSFQFIGKGMMIGRIVGSQRAIWNMHKSYYLSFWALLPGGRSPGGGVV